MDEKGFGPWLDRDALSLVLLTVMETAFYFLQVGWRRKKLAA